MGWPEMISHPLPAQGLRCPGLIFVTKLCLSHSQAATQASRATYVPRAQETSAAQAEAGAQEPHPQQHRERGPPAEDGTVNRVSPGPGSPRKLGGQKGRPGWRPTRRGYAKGTEEQEQQPWRGVGGPAGGVLQMPALGSALSAKDRAPPPHRGLELQWPWLSPEAVDRPPPHSQANGPTWGLRPRQAKAGPAPRAPKAQQSPGTGVGNELLLPHDSEYRTEGLS